jgi:hypothetical protein
LKSTVEIIKRVQTVQKVQAVQNFLNGCGPL